MLRKSWRKSNAGKFPRYGGRIATSSSTTFTKNIRIMCSSCFIIVINTSEKIFFLGTCEPEHDTHARYN